MKLLVLLVIISNFFIFDAAPTEDRNPSLKIGATLDAENKSSENQDTQIDVKDQIQMTEAWMDEVEDEYWLFYRYYTCTKFVKNLCERIKASGNHINEEEFVKSLPFNCQTDLWRKKRDLGELWNRMKTHVDDTKTGMSKNKEDLRNKWVERFQKIKDSYNDINALALEFISYSRDMKADFIKESRDLFRSHQRLLTMLWENIKESAKDAIDK